MTSAVISGMEACSFPPRLRSNVKVRGQSSQLQEETEKLSRCWNGLARAENSLVQKSKPELKTANKY